MKIENFLANLHNNKEFIAHMINLNQALNHRSVLRKLHKVIKFNQKALFFYEIFYQ